MDIGNSMSRDRCVESRVEEEAVAKRREVGATMAVDDTPFGFTRVPTL